MFLKRRIVLRQNSRLEMGLRLFLSLHWGSPGLNYHILFPRLCPLRRFDRSVLRHPKAQILHSDRHPCLLNQSVP
jgi:hypothetical protein